MREWFRVEAAGGRGKGGGEILIFSHIGKRWSQDTEAVEAKAFVEALHGLVSAGPGDITVRINSPGGDVGAGMTIYNALRAVRNRVVCKVEGYAYSMASVIALAGRETQMADVGQFMVHNPTTVAWGGQKEMERAIAALKTARATLIKAYSKKTGKPDADIEALMDETTFMTADEAKEFGFVDVILDGADIVEGAVAACFDAGAWAAYYQGNGPVPVEPPVAGIENGELGIENASPDGSGVLDDGGAGGPEGSQEPGAGKPPLHSGGDAPEETKNMGLKMGDIKAACEGASSDFIVAQFELCEANESRTLVDVMKAFQGEQAKALAAANAAVEAAQAAATAQKNSPPATAPGVVPVAASGGSDEPEPDPITAWEDAVAAGEARKLTRAQAIRAVVVAKPELHRAYLDAYNAQHGRVIN